MDGGRFAFTFGHVRKAIGFSKDERLSLEIGMYEYIVLSGSVVRHRHSGRSLNLDE